MTYENGGQLDRALKKAVRDRGGDPGDGYRQALRDRFLCRVFSDPDGRFWIGYIFLDDFGRTKPAFLNSTGVMYPSVECILKLLYQCT